jgi:hypothetical protein
MFIERGMSKQSVPRPITNSLCRLYLRKGVTAVLKVLDRIEDIARDTPPANNNSSRFGNPAFKTFYDRVSEVRESPLYLGTPL